MKNFLASLALESQPCHPVAINRRARRASRLAAHVGLILAFVASCMMPGPYQQGAYQQGAYQQGAYQQGQYQQGQGQPTPMDPYGSGMNQPEQTGMSVVYQPPTKNPERQEIQAFLQQTQMFEQVAAGINRVLRVPKAVTIVWTECGTVNAAWDGENILMCYELAEYLKSMYGKRFKNRKQIRVAVMSSLMFIFLHEVGHALISLYQLPAVGREEDAADQLAALLLITNSGDSGETAMHGAQFFRLLAQSSPNTPLFDEHSLDAQRHYNVMCLVYGSDPDRLGFLVGNDKLPASRARRCPTEYTKLLSAWKNLLAPHTRGDQASQPGRQQRSTTPPSVYAPSQPSRGSSGGGGTSSGWLCTAEGTMRSASEDGQWSYSTERGYGDGPTRDRAYLKALENCYSLLKLAASLGSVSGEIRDAGTCKVVDCIGQ